MDRFGHATYPVHATDPEWKSSLPITATRFKEKSLELCDDVHDQKRSWVVIAKRGKPYTKLIPIDEPIDEPIGEKEEPFHGCLSGLATYSGDLTEPTGRDWEALHD